LTCARVGPDPQVSVRHQCELLELCRSSYYYEPCPETEENLALMRQLDELHLEHPVYGSRKLTVLLRQAGLGINRKRVVRLLRLMGIEAIYAKPKLSVPALGHEIYPYLLRDLEVTGPDQVWCADITYVPMARGFMYLVAVMDWWSRYVLAWRLSNTMEAAFCVDAWEAALRVGRRAPLISNTDQGAQFTAAMFVDAVQSAGVEVSMDGRGRWLDNRFIERLWRSAKYEDISICKIMATGWRPDAGWGVGLMATMPSGPTRPWVMPLRRKCISRPTHTAPSRPPGKPCDPGTADAATRSRPPGRNARRIGTTKRRTTKKLEVRPPAAVRVRSQQKSEREDGQCPSPLVLSFRKFFEAQTEKTQTKTNDSRPRESILIPALSGLKIGVHLYPPSSDYGETSVAETQRSTPVFPAPSACIRFHPPSSDFGVTSRRTSCVEKPVGQRRSALPCRWRPAADGSQFSTQFHSFSGVHLQEPDGGAPG